MTVCFPFATGKDIFLKEQKLNKVGSYNLYSGLANLKAYGSQTGRKILSIALHKYIFTRVNPQRNRLSHLPETLFGHVYFPMLENMETKKYSPVKIQTPTQLLGECPPTSCLSPGKTRRGGDSVEPDTWGPLTESVVTQLQLVINIRKRRPGLAKSFVLSKESEIFT